MKTLPRFEETEITVEDGIITIRQVHNYTSNRIAIPVELWEKFWNVVDDEINESTRPAKPDLGDQLFQTMAEQARKDVKEFSNG